MQNFCIATDITRRHFEAVAPRIWPRFALP